MLGFTHLVDGFLNKTRLLMFNIDVITECRTKKFPFPEVIKRLTAIGIERYYTDLMRMEKIYYSHNGDSYVERMPIEDMPQLADKFNDAKIVESIRANQKDEIDYHNLIRNIVAAGT